MAWPDVHIGWIFDPPSGTFRNPELSKWFRDEASARANVRLKEVPYTATWSDTIGAVDVDNADPTVKNPLDFAIRRLLDLLVNNELVHARTEWIELPTLRRMIPHNYGRNYSIAYYGILPMGLPPMCKQPQTHAADCECATL